MYNPSWHSIFTSGTEVTQNVESQEDPARILS